MHDNTRYIAPYVGALAAYRSEVGPHWKRQLRDDWLADHRRQWGTLRRLRNDTNFSDFDAIFSAFATYEERWTTPVINDKEGMAATPCCTTVIGGFHVTISRLGNGTRTCELSRDGARSSLLIADAFGALSPDTDNELPIDPETVTFIWSWAETNGY